MRHLIILALCIIAIACSRPFEPRAADVLGEWQKLDDKLPPINLELTRAGEDLHARLRLSGVDVQGTAQLDGSQLILVLPGRAEPLLGEFVSSTELQLRFDAPGRVYTLRKK